MISKERELVFNSLECRLAVAEGSRIETGGNDGEDFRGLCFDANGKSRTRSSNMT